MREELVNLIAKKLLSLGGELAGPASESEVIQVERRLAATLPIELKNFLRQHNGSSKETDEGLWRFWSCAEISSHADYRGVPFFDLNEIEKDLIQMVGRLPGERLILFSDAMIDLPTYGVFLLPGHPCDGWVFDSGYGYVSARSFTEWVTAFTDHGEEGLLLPSG
ncbi:MAG TPA: SMI1/KNR4 family protein [Luteolibacter sp.]